MPSWRGASCLNGGCKCTDACGGHVARRAALQELAHYALATTDLEFNYPFGWEELWGIANRGDFDLKAHSDASKVSLQYTDATTKQVRHVTARTPPTRFLPSAAATT